MTKRTTWNDGELRKLYRTYRYLVIVVIVHVIVHVIVANLALKFDPKGLNL